MQGDRGVLFLSDLHIVDEDQCAKIATLAPRLPKGLLSLTVFLGGDLTAGSGIHPRQDAMLQLSAEEQSNLCVRKALKPLLKRLCKRYDHNVEVVCILGNHGRTSRYNRPEDNWDLNIGERILDADICPTRVVKDAPHAIFTVGSTRFYGIHRTRRADTHLESNAKKGMVYERLMRHKADVFLLAHFHHGKHHGDQEGNLRLVVNGHLADPEPFYDEENSYWTRPSQAFIRVPERGLPTVDDVMWLRW